MKPLSYFQELESDQAKRSDPNEGIQGIYQPDQITVSIGVDGKIHELRDLAGPVIVLVKTTFFRKDIELH